MENKEKLELLGRAFAYGEIDELSKYLHKDCRYNSDYAQKHYTTADKIIESMQTVIENVRKATDRDSSYTYKTIKLSEVFNEGIDLDDLHGDTFFDVFEYGLLLYQFGDPAPVSVVFVKFNPGGYISEINLSRNRKWFDLQFYGTQDLSDSEKDVPYTVKPMTVHDRQVKEMQAVWTHQAQDYENLDDEEVYIWRQADRFFKEWLDNGGYHVLETEIFDDSIGYRCLFNDHVYTVYMFASGQEEKIRIDGTYCANLCNRDFSKGFILVSCLRVARERSENGMQYKVGFHNDADNDRIELWHPHSVEGKNILLYFPREDMFSIMDKLIYAFNHESLDAFSCIISEKNPSFSELDEGGVFLNDAFYYSMARIHKTKGDMALGYMTYDGIIYSMAPYIENYGWFDFSVDEKRKISRLQVHAFEEPGTVFVHSEEQISEDTFKDIPRIISVSSLPRELTERFALIATFENGAVKKYVLPVTREDEELDAVSYKRHVFSDGIWNSARIIESPDAWYKGFDHCLPGVIFKNGFVLSGMLIYEEGTNYSVPQKCQEVVYEDEALCLERIWTWKISSLYEDEGTGVLKVLLSGQAFNWDGVSTLASINGDRICSLDLSYLSGSEEGFIEAGVSGRGYGFIDNSGHFAIPPVYSQADEFSNGYAHVQKDGKWLFLNKKGEEIRLSTKYEDIGHFSEGLCKVSVLKLGFMDLAYHSDNSEIAGNWGFVNEKGQEIVAPQYIYAYDFEDGIAIVCKGKWTKDSKWDNKYNKGRYWTEEELWGGIDKDGKEVIPFIFDEIKHMWDCNNEVFMAHYGGWKDGHWGIIGRDGRWLAKPVFEDIDYEYHNGLFAFYAADKWNGDDVPLGIYDIKQGRVIFEPQFTDVYFMDDGYITVELFYESLGRKIEKVISLDGKEKFHSEYTSISTYRSNEPWEVCIENDGVRKHGLIDHDGNVILPCIYDTSLFGISSKYERIIVNVGNKVAMIDFKGNTIIPAKYDSIQGLDQPLYLVTCKKEDGHSLNGLVTHNGKEILPPVYDRISICKDKKHVICGKDGLWAVLVLTEKE